jgi:uncharacterized protein YlzI (FlbEa/FlbD family)
MVSEKMKTLPETTIEFQDGKPTATRTIHWEVIELLFGIDAVTKMKRQMKR